MGVTAAEKDYDDFTLTLTADFTAPVEHVWQMWADPRNLDRWWGPASYPATFERFELAPGEVINFFMTGPNAEMPRGWWRIKAVEAPTFLEFVDGFADDEGVPVPGMPTMTVRMVLSEHQGGTRMELRSLFESPEAMEKVLSMGAEEGLIEAIGQMDALLTP